MYKDLEIRNSGKGRWYAVILQEGESQLLLSVGMSCCISKTQMTNVFGIHIFFKICDKLDAVRIDGWKEAA